MKYGLTPKQLQEIEGILRAYPDIREVWLFGSRALGTYKEASDIDLAIKGELGSKTLLRLKDDFEESDLPFFVDLVDYERITEPALKQHIDTHGVCIFGGGEGMAGWRDCRLGDFAEIQTGPFGSQLHAADYVDDGVPSIMPTNIGARLEIRTDSIACIKNADAKRLEKYLVRENDIVYSRRGDVEKCAFITEKQSGWLCGTGCLRVRFTSNDIEPKFCAYYLSTDEIKGWVSGNAVGTTMPNLNSTILQRLPLTLPSLPEQKAIAAILSSLDDKIDLLHRQNKTLEAMAETLFRQWFVEEAQEDWEEVTVSKFVELNRASIDKSYPHTTIEYLDTGSLNAGRIENFQSVVLDEAPSRARRLVQHNDVLISTVRPDQKHYGIIKNPADSLVVSTGFCVLTCTKIDPHFIYLLLTNDEMTDYLHSIADGSTSTYPSLKPADIGAIAFQLPPGERLKEFSVIADNTWEKIERNYIQIRTLENLRDTLLPKLMSGEVRVALDAVAA